MLAARDQENLTHTHQTTAASKPLNQGVRALNPRTPGVHKTPFRPSKNDENRPLDFKGQKTVLKDGPSKLDKNTFVTPMAPRTRAPLGMKTTNAKSQAFKTPGPLQQNVGPDRTAKKPSTTRRSAKPKITVAPSEPVHADVLQHNDDDEPEYGYAPPPIAELPDPPIEFDYDQTFPQFQGENMFRGYGEIYCTTPTDENGMSLRLKREEEMYREFTQEQERKSLVTLHLPALPTEEELDAQVDAMIAAGSNSSVSKSKVDTVKSKLAAAMLSEPNQRLPSAASRPTKASEMKRKAIDRINSSTTFGARASTDIVSKNTIGFPKAKNTPSIVPKADQMRRKAKPRKIDQSKIHPKDFVRLYGEPPAESKMWFRLREHELLEEQLNDDDDLADNLFDTEFFPSGEEGEDGDEVFQLPIPE